MHSVPHLDDSNWFAAEFHKWINVDRAHAIPQYIDRNFFFWARADKIYELNEFTVFCLLLLLYRFFFVRWLLPFFIFTILTSCTQFKSCTVNHTFGSAKGKWQCDLLIVFRNLMCLIIVRKQWWWIFNSVFSCFFSQFNWIGGFCLNAVCIDASRTSHRKEVDHVQGCFVHFNNNNNNWTKMNLIYILLFCASSTILNDVIYFKNSSRIAHHIFCDDCFVLFERGKSQIISYGPKMGGEHELASLEMSA